jgi:hypothetical protein
MSNVKLYRVDHTLQIYVAAENAEEAAEVAVYEWKKAIPEEMDWGEFCFRENHHVIKVSSQDLATWGVSGDDGAYYDTLKHGPNLCIPLSKAAVEGGFSIDSQNIEKRIREIEVELEELKALQRSKEAV